MSISSQGRPLFLQSSRNVSVNIVNSNNQLLTQLVTGKIQLEQLSCSLLMFSFDMMHRFVFQKISNLTSLTTSAATDARHVTFLDVPLVIEESFPFMFSLGKCHILYRFF